MAQLTASALQILAAQDDRNRRAATAALIALLESGDVPPETLAALLGDRDALIRAAVMRGGHPGT